MTGTLARRITLACLLVAVLAVGVSALVGLRLVAVTARDTTAELLAGSADLLAGQPDRAAAVALLRAQGVAVVELGPDGRPGPADPRAREAVERAGAARAVAGGPVSAAVRIGRTDVLVEARAAPGGAVALVRDADGPGTAVVRRNLQFALLVGGAVAVAVGIGLARLLARSLRRTAVVAHLLRTGRRDVRVPVEGPAEVAEVAGAVNELVAALARSEGRQREFLLSVSHELRTPLTAVRGFGESVADGVVTGAAAAAGRTIVAEAVRLERLVDDLMDLARLQADDFRLDPVAVDLVALLDAAAAVWAARCAAAGVAFGWDPPPRPVVVRADPRRLRQVVDALADNALRVTPPGAPVRFALHEGPPRLEVRDGGPGLEPAEVPDAFRRGALHERHRGTARAGSAGVGLTLVHGLVTRMGGTVAVGRAPEGGAAFTVTLPG